jgi:tetratricopeptide (TPR) repeat protein
VAFLCAQFTTVPAVFAQGAATALEGAREAARANRNAEAARLFATHLAAHPRDRRSVLREYADQLIYSQRPEQALSLLKEILSWQLTPDERRTALTSRALALLWSDQHRQALATYDRILADEPGSADAHFNRIRAIQWLGRPDRAQAALAQLPSDLRESAKALEIGRELSRGARPATAISLWRMSQADGLDLKAGRIEQNVFAGSGVGRLGLFYEYRHLADGHSEVRVHLPGISGLVRASDSLQLSGWLGLERQRGSGGKRTAPVYEAAAAWMPSDRLRVDMVTARSTLDNLTSLERGITTRRYFASADYRADPMLKLTLRGELMRFSDENDRRWVQAAPRQRLFQSQPL